jgi:hypothetical protein
VSQVFPPPSPLKVCNRFIDPGALVSFTGKTILIKNQKSIQLIAAIGLISGAVFGMTGSFVSSVSLRSLAWGIDGISLVVATALLTVFYFRKGSDITASGFLVFAIGQSLVLSSSGPALDTNVFIFGAGAGLWSTSLFLISSQKTYPVILRFTGAVAAILFAIVAVQVFMNQAINAGSKPFPFYAFPFFAFTILGWAWMLGKKAVGPGEGDQAAKTLV